MRSKFRTSSKAPPALVRARVSFLAPGSRPGDKGHPSALSSTLQETQIIRLASRRPLVQTRKNTASI